MSCTPRHARTETSLARAALPRVRSRSEGTVGPMAKRKQQKPDQLVPAGGGDYDGLLSGLSALLDQSRRSAARAVNAVLTATHWEVGRRLVEFEQGGEARAGYGGELLKRLGADLTKRHGRGFSRQNLQLMRAFYLGSRHRMGTDIR